MRQLDNPPMPKKHDDKPETPVRKKWDDGDRFIFFIFVIIAVVALTVIATLGK